MDGLDDIALMAQVPVRCFMFQVSVVMSAAGLMFSMTAPLSERSLLASATEMLWGSCRRAHAEGCPG